MKLPFNLKGNIGGGLSVASVLKKLKGKISWILWACLFLFALFTGLVIRSELAKVSQVQTDSAAIFERMVKVNMNQHKAVEAKLQENSSFQPVSVPGADAFGAEPTAANNP